MSLTTGRCLARQQWTCVPMPDSVITAVEARAVAKGQPLIAGSCPLFEWTCDVEITDHMDDDDDGDDNGEAEPVDAVFHNAVIHEAPGGDMNLGNNPALAGPIDGDSESEDHEAERGIAVTTDKSEDEEATDTADGTTGDASTRDGDQETDNSSGAGDEQDDPWEWESNDEGLLGADSDSSDQDGDALEGEIDEEVDAALEGGLAEVPDDVMPVGDATATKDTGGNWYNLRPHHGRTYGH